MFRTLVRMNKGPVASTMDSIKNAAKAVGDTVKQGTATVSKEANKAAAKDSDLSAGTRATAAKDAVKDKVNETANKASATANQEKSKL